MWRHHRRIDKKTYGLSHLDKLATFDLELVTALGHHKVDNLPAELPSSIGDLKTSDLQSVAAIQLYLNRLLAGRAGVPATHSLTGMAAVQQPGARLVAGGQLVVWVVRMAPARSQLNVKLAAASILSISSRTMSNALSLLSVSSSQRCLAYNIFQPGTAWLFIMDTANLKGTEFNPAQGPNTARVLI